MWCIDPVGELRSLVGPYLKVLCESTISSNFALRRGVYDMFFVMKYRVSDTPECFVAVYNCLTDSRCCVFLGFFSAAA